MQNLSQKTAVFFLAAIFIFFFSLSAALAGAKDQKKPIKIGAIYNLTGSQKALDRASMYGAQLAVAEINAKGGVLGRPLKLETINGKTNPKVIADAAHKLASDKNIQVIIGLSDTDMARAAILKIAAQDKLYVAALRKLFITSGATSPELITLAPEHVCLACFIDSDQAAAAAEFALQKLKAKNIYLITQGNMDYAKFLTLYFQKHYENLGGKIIGQNKFSAHHANLKSFLKKLNPTTKAKINAFYLTADPEQVPNLVRQIRAAGFQQPILGGDSFDSQVLTQKNKNLSQVYFTTHAFLAPNNPNPQVKQFMQAYQKAYHQMPESSFAGLGFDTIKLLARAMTKAKSTASNKVRDALMEIQNFHGVTGMIQRIGTDCIPVKSVSIIEVQNGQRSLVEEWPAAAK